MKSPVPASSPVPGEEAGIAYCSKEIV